MKLSESIGLYNVDTKLLYKNKEKMLTFLVNETLLYDREQIVEALEEGVCSGWYSWGCGELILVNGDMMKNQGAFGCVCDPATKREKEAAEQNNMGDIILTPYIPTSRRQIMHSSIEALEQKILRYFKDKNLANRSGVNSCTFTGNGINEDFLRISLLIGDPINDDWVYADVWFDRIRWTLCGPNDRIFQEPTHAYLYIIGVLENKNA